MVVITEKIAAAHDYQTLKVLKAFCNQVQPVLIRLDDNFCNLADLIICNLLESTLCDNFIVLKKQFSA